MDPDVPLLLPPPPRPKFEVPMHPDVPLQVWSQTSLPWAEHGSNQTSGFEPKRVSLVGFDGLGTLFSMRLPLVPVRPIEPPTRDLADAEVPPPLPSPPPPPLTRAEHPPPPARARAASIRPAPSQRAARGT